MLRIPEITLACIVCTACGSKPAANPDAPEPEPEPQLEPSPSAETPPSPDPPSGESTPPGTSGPECGGYAGKQCAEGLTCVDDPSDGCDPARGGKDCGGICRAAVGGVECGKTTCAAGQICCNESCGICAPPGGACTQQFCN